MADEKIILTELDFDTDSAVKNAIALKEEIALLKAQTQKAKKETGETSAEYIKYNAALKSTQGELRSQENLLKKLSSAQSDNAGTIQKLEAQNAELRQAQKRLNLETEEGRIQNEKWNEIINKNSEFIKENVDQRKKEILNIGNYPGAFDKMNDAMGESVPVVNKVNSSFKALLANPFVAVFAAIVGAIGLLVKAFKRSESNMNSVKKVTGALSGVFNGLLKVIEPVAKFIANTLVKGFEALGDAADKALGFVSKALGKLGFDKAAERVENFTKVMEASAKAGLDLAAMEAEYQKAVRNSQKIQLDYQRQAEKLRQVRDDESKGLNERISANEKLGEVLKKQLNTELQIHNQALAIAEKRIEIEGDTTDNLDARAEALTTIADIQERITGQESEQLVNINSLRKELAEQTKMETLELAEDTSEEYLSILEEQTNKELELEVEKSEKILEKLNRGLQNEKVAKETDFENKMQIAQGNIFAETELERQKLEEMRRQEISFAEKIGADVSLVNKKYDKADLELTKATTQAKANLLTGFFNSISTIAGEGTAIGKAAAVAEASVSSVLGAQQAFAAAQIIPPPFGQIIGGANAAAALAVGAANVRKILSVKSGLPGDKSVSGNVPTASTGVGGGNIPNQAQNVNPEIGKGIATRDIGQTSKTIVDKQPVLVEDDITFRQSKTNERESTQVL
jgi:hypothetical protein